MYEIKQLVRRRVELFFGNWSLVLQLTEGSRAGVGIFTLSDPPFPSSVTGFEQAIKKREGIVCLRGQGSGYDLSSKRQCSVLQPIARTACVRYCSWAAQRTDHGGVLLYLSGRLAGSKSMRACSEAMNDPCQEETQSSIIFDGLFCSFAEKTKLYIQERLHMKSNFEFMG